MATDTQREKRRLILRAAITVFARSGYHTSRVSDVAKEAGVAYGLIYHYFGSKEDLLEQIFRRTWSRIYGALEVILTGWVFHRLPAEPDDVRRAEETVVALLSDGLAVD